MKGGFWWLTFYHKSPSKGHSCLHTKFQNRSTFPSGRKARTVQRKEKKEEKKLTYENNGHVKTMTVDHFGPFKSLGGVVWLCENIAIAMYCYSNDQKKLHPPRQHVFQLFWAKDDWELRWALRGTCLTSLRGRHTCWGRWRCRWPPPLTLFWPAAWRVSTPRQRRNKQKQTDPEWKLFKTVLSCLQKVSREGMISPAPQESPGAIHSHTSTSWTYSCQPVELLLRININLPTWFRAALGLIM